MKKIIKHFALFGLLLFFACSDEELDVANPNEPTFDAIESEAGITQLATGVYDAAGAFFHWVVFAYHESMGDAVATSAGNWGLRWTNQPTSITLDDGTVVTPPQEGPQREALEVRNVRTQVNENAYANPWRTMYAVNNTGNLILDLVDQTEFSGDVELKRSVFKAWAYFWKGYAYSRIGSFYTAGLIISEPNTTNNEFVSSREVIAEARRNLDLAKAELEQISGSIAEVTSSIIPSHLVPSPFRGSAPSAALTKDVWIRNINTLIARNILVNTKVADMTPADWTEITTLTNEGIQASDFVFVMKQDGNYEQSTTVNARIVFGWHNVSERIIQDFKEGDQRYEDNVEEFADPIVNPRGRGIHYGTRFDFMTNGDYAITEDNKANVYYAGSYDENELMKAEALIYSGQIDAGLALIDGVREHQQAGLDAVSGTGLTESEALEELRRERRIGLLLRGVSFYDARRWDITKTPRSGLTVLQADGNVSTNATINYNYLDYWSVPDQELEFNQPNQGSVPVVSPR